MESGVLMNAYKNIIYIYIYGAISHNVHYEKGCSVSPYMPYHMSEKGVPPYGKAFSGRQGSPFRIAV